MALKELEVRYASKRQKDYKLADGEGLYLLVRPNGSKAPRRGCVSGSRTGAQDKRRTASSWAISGSRAFMSGP